MQLARIDRRMVVGRGYVVLARHARGFWSVAAGSVLPDVHDEADGYDSGQLGDILARAPSGSTLVLPVTWSAGHGCAWSDGDGGWRGQTISIGHPPSMIDTSQRFRRRCVQRVEIRGTVEDRRPLEPIKAADLGAQAGGREPIDPAEASQTGDRV
jgi:hypothetical protein